MDKPPKKPSAVAAWLYKNGFADKMKVDYRMTGVDTADTWVILWSSRSPPARLECRPGSILGNPEVELAISCNSIVTLTAEGRRVCHEREEYEETHAKELAEYQRLKDKFG